MCKGRVLKLGNITVDKEYERSMTHQYGISDETVGAKGITMTRGMLGPGKRTRCHYHINAEMADYIISGRVRIIFGIPGMETYDMIAEAGDMVYAPPGVAHVFENLSDTEPVILVGTYSCGNAYQSGKMLVEPPLE